MTVYEEFTSNLLAYTHHFETEALLGSTPGSYCITHRQILAHNAAFMVFVVIMLLWFLMGSPAKVENKGLSAWPDNTIWIV